MWIYSLLKNKIDKLASKFSPNPTQLWISKNKINKIAHDTIACTFDIQFIGLGCKSQVDVHCCTSNEISFLCCIKHGNVFILEHKHDYCLLYDIEYCTHLAIPLQIF